GGLDQAGLLDGVHLGRVGREEDVGRGARLELAREVVRSGEREFDLRAASGRELSPERLEGLGQAGRGEDEERAGLGFRSRGGGGRRGRRGRENEQDRQNSLKHGSPLPPWP